MEPVIVEIILQNVTSWQKKNKMVFFKENILNKTKSNTIKTVRYLL